MKNPSEEITTAWLQECMHFFTMNNVKVPRKGGGMGAEIDILATNRRKNIWIEVSVSTNPRCNHRKEVRFKDTINEYMAEFRRKDKRRKVEEFFGKNYEKWFVHGKLALNKDEISRFPKQMKQKRVYPIYFGDIFKDMRKLRQYRLDSARGYMNLFEAFHND